MTTQDLATRNGAIAQTLEQVLIQGDLSPLTPEMRVQYYHEVCHSLGLNEATRPFEYLLLGEGQQKKLVLYARKDCTEQLRKLHGVSITGLETGRVGDLFIATAHARDTSGREDTDMGAVPVVKENGTWREAGNGKRYFNSDGSFADLTGDALANAMLKAVTKAKRRVTLSLCGLGMLDESEVEAIPGARTVTGEDTITPPAVNVQAPQRTHDEVFPDDADPQPTRMATVRSRLGQGYAELVEEAARLDVPYETIAYPVPESLVIEKGKALRAKIEAKKAALVTGIAQPAQEEAEF